MNQSPSSPAGERLADANQAANPSLYEIFTRATLGEISRRLGRPSTFDDISDEDLDLLAQRGFDWIWLLGVWQTGPAARKVSSERPEWQAGFHQLLADFREEDISGSPFAITGYTVHSDFGGNAALRRLRERMHRRGMRLMLDFVPNHTAPDHPWIETHPEFYVEGTEEDLRREPQNYVRLQTSQASRVLAYGRDPYFAGWPDTLQLNYAESSLQQAMQRELHAAAALCDGLRCDMAMLLLPEIFERTWGRKAEAFWSSAIRSVRLEHPGFLFMAEVYWDLEWVLQQQGFDYTYDKRLYDRLREGHARAVRDHLQASMEFQRKCARFLENHDEPRAAAVFPPEVHRAAAVITFLCPGMRFFEDGQLEGRISKLSVHLGRLPSEPVDPLLREFYDRLLLCLREPIVRRGEWRLLDCRPAWRGNGTWENVLCFCWQAKGEAPLLVAVNYAPTQSQSYVAMDWVASPGDKIRLQDLLNPVRYDRDGEALCSQGLYLDLKAWGYHVFQCTKIDW